MDTRIALLGIIVENIEITDELNRLLHQYSQYMIGRMGIPYREREVAIISLVVDAPETVIGALAGKIGQLPGLSVKTVYSKQRKN